jgi:hypothetical protein
MPTGHQHGTGGRANAPPHVVAQFDAFFEKMINVRGWDKAAGVGANVASAHVVTQQENDVGLGR